MNISFSTISLFGFRFFITLLTAAIIADPVADPCPTVTLVLCLKSITFRSRGRISMIRILVIEMSTLIILDDYPMKPGVYDAVLEGCFVLVPKLAPPTYQIDFGSEDPSDYSTI
jgi:hypothetical protein